MFFRSPQVSIEEVRRSGGPFPLVSHRQHRFCVGGGTSLFSYSSTSPFRSERRDETYRASTQPSPTPAAMPTKMGTTLTIATTGGLLPRSGSPTPATGVPEEGTRNGGKVDPRGGNTHYSESERLLAQPLTSTRSLPSAGFRATLARRLFRPTFKRRHMGFVMGGSDAGDDSGGTRFRRSDTWAAGTGVVIRRDRNVGIKTNPDAKSHRHDQRDDYHGFRTEITANTMNAPAPVLPSVEPYLPHDDEDGHVAEASSGSRRPATAPTPASAVATASKASKVSPTEAVQRTASGGDTATSGSKEKRDKGRQPGVFGQIVDYTGAVQREGGPGGGTDVRTILPFADKSAADNYVSSRLLACVGGEGGVRRLKQGGLYLHRADPSRGDIVSTNPCGSTPGH